MRLQFGSLNHAPGGTINPQRPVAADATALILLPLSGHNGHGRTCRRFGAVVNDPWQTLSGQICCSAQRGTSTHGMC